MARLVFVSKALLKAIVLPASVLLLSSGQLVVAEPPATDLEQRMKEERIERTAVQERISEAEEEVTKLTSQEVSVVQGLERLNHDLQKSQAELRRIRREMEGLEVQINSLKAEEASLAREIKDLEHFAIRRLTAFYKLGQLGVAPIVFSAKTFSQMWQRREALQRIMEYDADLWDRLQDQKGRLATVAQDLKNQRTHLEQLLVKSKEEGARIEEQRADRAKVLKSIRADKRLTLASIASFKEAAKRLDDTINSIERKLRSPSTSMLFARLKGSLPMPVKGKIVGPFGTYMREGNYNIKGYRSGVTIEASLGAPVRAVCDGQVVYAGWFKGYGNIMIVDHGEHYYTLSAPLEELFRKKGEAVLSGEVIGTYGDVATLSGPGLYFEVRHHGKPMDPVSWFKN